MAAQATKKSFKRLPQTVIPTHYDLTIQSFLDKFTFNGSVIIDLQVCVHMKNKSNEYILSFFKVKESTDTMILYAAELKVDNVKLKLNSNGNLEMFILIFNKNIVL